MRDVSSIFVDFPFFASAYLGACLVVVKSTFEKLAHCPIEGNLQLVSNFMKVSKTLGRYSPSCVNFDVGLSNPPRLEKKFYVVKRGLHLGIYNTWTECEPFVKYFSRVQFQTFKIL